MSEVLTVDEVADLRNWQCRDGHDLSDEQLHGICDSHESLRAMLRKVLASRPKGCRERTVLEMLPAATAREAEGGARG